MTEEASESVGVLGAIGALGIIVGVAMVLGAVCSWVSEVNRSMEDIKVIRSGVHGIANLIQDGCTEKLPTTLEKGDIRIDYDKKQWNKMRAK